MENKILNIEDTDYIRSMDILTWELDNDEHVQITQYIKSDGPELFEKFFMHFSKIQDINEGGYEGLYETYKTYEELQSLQECFDTILKHYNLNFPLI